MNHHHVSSLALGSVMLVAFGAGLWLYLRNPKYVPQKLPPQTIEWTMLPVSGEHAQADAHLLRLASGEVWLIDAGQSEIRLVDLLEDLAITRVDRVFISHPHFDHYRGLHDLIPSDITIGEVLMNLPTQKQCEAEPWGCEMADLDRLMAALFEKKIPHHPLTEGQVLFDREGIRLEVLYAYDGIHTPIGPTDLNDTSVILALHNGTSRALFTGDLNMGLGTHLTKIRDPRLKAQLLKVPHHGTDGVAPNSFFEWVEPEAALVPSPKALWLSERSARIRDWFSAKKIPTYVNGISGAIRVLISPGKFSITPALK